MGDQSKNVEKQVVNIGLAAYLLASGLTVRSLGDAGEHKTSFHFDDPNNEFNRLCDEYREGAAIPAGQYYRCLCTLRHLVYDRRHEQGQHSGE